jgi:hypothetical protein
MSTITTFYRGDMLFETQMGSHGRRGIGALLGSTVDGALHQATVDVLVVRAQP